MTFGGLPVYAAVLVMAFLFGCQRSSEVSGDVVATYFQEERKSVDMESSWIESDAALLSATCAKLTPTLNSRLRSGDQGNALHDFQERKATCDELATWRSSALDFRKRASMIDKGDDFETLHYEIGDLRSRADGAIQGFPTSSFRESNFPAAAASEYQAKHEAIATEAGALAVDAVTTAREASGAAVKRAQNSDHELDRTRARLSDEAYTRASQLAELQHVKAATEVIPAVDEILSNVDGAIGSAQGTGHVGGNPVAGVQEVLPSVASTPVATQTAKETQIPPPPASYRAVPAAQASSQCSTTIKDPNPPTNVRSTPNGVAIGSLTNGTAVTVVERNLGWLRISSPMSGWIYASLTTHQCSNSH